MEPGSDAERVATLYTRARAHSDAGEDTAAVTTYRQLLKIDPRHVRARNNLALLLERRGNVQGALEELEQAIAAEPDNVSLLLNRAAVLSAHRYAHRWILAYREQGRHDLEASQVAHALRERAEGLVRA